MILTGNCLDVLKTMPANSVDSVVTDPPYGLSKEPDIAEVMRHWLNGDTYEHGSNGFMGKSWDSFVPGPEYWREVFRVLKPGGHILVFAGTRTWDLMSMALRFAGFQNRDTIASFGGPPGLAWTYGSGFPKSLDVSKALDRMHGAEREVIGRKTGGAHTAKSGNGGIGQGKFANSAREQSNCIKDKTDNMSLITAPATDDAKKWQGWGTALKPAWETILVFRKPLEGTVAQNVLEHGTGALNIDKSRIGTNGEKLQSSTTTIPKYRSVATFESSTISKPSDQHAQGRWPANVLFNEAAAKVLDEQSGVSKSVLRPPNAESPTGNGNTMGAMKGIDTKRGHADSGGASRFFFVAKSSKRERNAGLEGMTEKSWQDQGYRDNETTHLSPRAGAGRTSANANHHPTIKPVKLMEYLVRLITPDGGTVLDPFCGSGSTLIAARKLNFKFIGIEMNEEYVQIAERRIAAVEGAS